MASKLIAQKRLVQLWYGGLRGDFWVGDHRATLGRNFSGGDNDDIFSATAQAMPSSIDLDTN